MTLRLTRLVKIFLGAWLGFFIIQQLVDRSSSGAFTQIFGLIPYDCVMNLKVWQIVSYSFLHHDVSHLLLNALTFVFVAPDLQERWGDKRFLSFFFFSVISGGLAYLILQMILGDPALLRVPMVGASAGIYGLLLAYGLQFGERTLLFMMLFPMKAKFFVLILAGVELLNTVFTQGHLFSGLAHLGGMVGGAAFLFGRAYWLASQKSRAWTAAQNEKNNKRSHLKLVVNRDGSDNKPEDSKKDPKYWN